MTRAARGSLTTPTGSRSWAWGPGLTVLMSLPPPTPSAMAFKMSTSTTNIIVKDAGVSSVSTCVHDCTGQPRWIGKAQLVAARHLDQPEQAQFLRQTRVPGIVVRQRDVLGAVDVRLRHPHLRGIDLERDLVCQRPERVRV